MLILRGAPALSNFRQNKLLAALKDKINTVTGVYAEYVHVADACEPLSDAELKKLDTLLQYGPNVAKEEATGQMLFVTPRVGTISPWSSKATDIATNCGLTKVARLERGCAYYITAEEALSAEQIEIL
ncbi:MAG: hypothetical protein ACPG4U_03080, partial [Pseudomonadales bacterium]